MTPNAQPLRIDVVTIFPQYFDALEVSLLGRARAAGRVDWQVHDLRDFTTDVHRSVDDSPFGGGPGMVMRPDVWGTALSSLMSSGDASSPVLAVPSPAGQLFDQTLARSWSTQQRLVFACGRYEGIDARVVEHAQAEGWDVCEVSLGDYVLNGGEVAALAMIEATVRLIPGVVGNEASLLEESHEDGLLEYPVYTRPAQWGELAVPQVLQSGDHAAIARWRRDESLRRTSERRPDLIARYPKDRCDAADLRLLSELGWTHDGTRFISRVEGSR